MSRIRLSVVPIARVIYFRSAGPPPSIEDANAASDAWLAEKCSQELAEQTIAWERRHPLAVSIAPLPEGPRLDPMPSKEAGAEELATFRHATHAVVVHGASDATGDGWLGVSAYARGVARAFGGVMVDALTDRARPLDECHVPLAEVPTREVSASLSLPTGPNRWVFTTDGLGNLGLPEVWFEDVRAPQVGVAVTVIQELRDALAALAREHARARGLEGLVVRSLNAPSFGRVALAEANHPIVGPGLRAFAADQPRTPLGRLVGRRWSAARRPAGHAVA